MNTIRFEYNQYKKHVFACIDWYKEDTQKELYPCPVEVWRVTSFTQAGPAAFMPIQRCFCKFAAANDKMNGVEKLIVSPIQRTFW